MRVKTVKGTSKKVDLIFILLSTMFFILAMGFSILELNNNLNLLILLIAMIGTAVGYFSSITVAFIYSIFFIFIYASIHIYINITQGIPISFDVYFWMPVVTVFSITAAYLGKFIREIQEENNNLKKENDEFVLIDRETGLMSSQTFFNELQVFMRINERYDIKVYLMLVKIKYENDVIRILGESKYNKIVVEISKAINSMLREEDKKYILRDANMFGIILLSNTNGGKFVKSRLKEIVDKIEFKDDILINKVKLEVHVGVAKYDSKETKSPYEFFNMAKGDLGYDV